MHSTHTLSKRYKLPYPQLRKFLEAHQVAPIQSASVGTRRFDMWGDDALQALEARKARIAGDKAVKAASKARGSQLPQSVQSDDVASALRELSVEVRMLRHALNCFQKPTHAPNNLMTLPVLNDPPVRFSNGVSA